MSLSSGHERSLQDLDEPDTKDEKQYYAAGPISRSNMSLINLSDRGIQGIGTTLSMNEELQRQVQGNSGSYFSSTHCAYLLTMLVGTDVDISSSHQNDHRPVTTSSSSEMHARAYASGASAMNGVRNTDNDLEDNTTSDLRTLCSAKHTFVPTLRCAYIEVSDRPRLQSDAIYQ